MNLKQHQSRIKSLRPGDPDFSINDGFVVANRAGFELSTECPTEHQLIINTCLMMGWLKPVATMYDYELTMDKLKETQ